MLSRKSFAVALLTSPCGLASAGKTGIAYRVTVAGPPVSEGFAVNNAGASVGAYPNNCGQMTTTKRARGLEDE